jgi:hypothetical protein
MNARPDSGNLIEQFMGGLFGDDPTLSNNAVAEIAMQRKLTDADGKALGFSVGVNKETGAINNVSDASAAYIRDTLKLAGTKGLDNAAVAALLQNDPEAAAKLKAAVTAAGGTFGFDSVSGELVGVDATLSAAINTEKQLSEAKAREKLITGVEGTDKKKGESEIEASERRLLDVVNNESKNNRLSKALLNGDSAERTKVLNAFKHMDAGQFATVDASLAAQQKKLELTGKDADAKKAAEIGKVRQELQGKRSDNTYLGVLRIEGDKILADLFGQAGAAIGAGAT